MARNVSRDVQISKTMTYLLRHGAEQEGLEMTIDGFIKIEDLLRHKTLKNVTHQEILKIVENCSKKRFSIEYRDNSLNDDKIAYVRANQGHSLANVQVKMDEIKSASELENCIHGTYFKAWPSIQVQGLSKMNRQHIHLSEDFPSSGKVISGMRKNCELAVFINVEKAMNEGIKFYRSENNVILCPGNEEGFLKTKYFLRVLDLKKNTEVDFPTIDN